MGKTLTAADRIDFYQSFAEDCPVDALTQHGELASKEFEARVTLVTDPSQQSFQEEMITKWNTQVRQLFILD